LYGPLADSSGRKFNDGADFVPRDKVVAFFVLFDQAEHFEFFDVGVDIAVLAPQILCQGVNTGRSGLVQPVQQLEPFGSQIFEQCLQVAKIEPLNWFFRSPARVELVSDGKGFFEEVVRRFDANLKIILFHMPASLRASCLKSPIRLRRVVNS
jgi:hypothetical protein